MALRPFCVRCWTQPRTRALWHSEKHCHHPGSTATHEEEHSIDNSAPSMSRPDETLAAAAAILRGLAKGSTTSYTNGLKLPPYTLPGDDTPGKEDFEAEIAALARRIHYLESRADVVSRSLPDTPGEFPSLISPSSRSTESRGILGEPGTDFSAESAERASSNGTQSKRVNNLLAARDTRRLQYQTARSAKMISAYYVTMSKNKQSRSRVSEILLPR